VALNSFSFCYDESIDFVGEGASPPVIGNIGGQERVVTAPITGPGYVLNGDGSIYRTLSPACTSSDCKPNPPYRPTGDTATITITGQGALADLSDNGSLQYTQSEAGAESTTGALNTPGQAAVPQVYQGVWNPTSGGELSPFPRSVAGFTFFDEPLCAGIGSKAGAPAVATGTDDYWVYAFTANGNPAPGFPKYTGQWPGYGGVIGDPKMNGHLQLAWITREGWLYRWNISGKASVNTCWSHYQHDNYNSGNYAMDSARPAAIGNLSRGSGAKPVLRFSAPGGDYDLGRASHYEVRYSVSPITGTSFWHAAALTKVPAPLAAGREQTITLPEAALHLLAQRHVLYVAIRTVNASGNISALSNVIRLT
jgi:hypothetical protein